MWTMVKEGGWGALVAVGFGAIGILAAIIALAVLPLSRKGGHVVGAITLLFAFAAPAFGLIGMAMGRRLTEQAIGGGAVTHSQEVRLRHEGYRESQGAAKVGLYMGLFPLLAGAVAAFLGARRLDEERSSAVRWGAAGALTSIATLTIAGAAVASTRPLPPDMSRNEADLLDARAEVDVDLEAGCRALEDTIEHEHWHPRSRTEWPRFFNPDPRKTIPDFDATATRCTRDRFDKIKAAAPGALTVKTIDDLLASPLLVDDALRTELEAANKPIPAAVASSSSDAGAGIFGILGVAPTSSVAPNPKLPPTGTSTVTGSLPPEVVQRVIRQNMGRFRACYDSGLKTNPKLEGKVAVKLVIAANGSVPTAIDNGSTMPDQTVIQCILSAMRTLTFPAPEGGGIVTVSYPLVFKRAD